MLERNTQTILHAKYDIDISDYSDSEQLEIIKKFIARNDQIIDINNQKIELLKEIVTDMSNYLNGGGKVASK